MRRRAAPETPPMPASFAFIGERRDDPHCLLLLGEDGRCYAYHLPDGSALLVEPGSDEWAVEPDLPIAEGLFT